MRSWICCGLVFMAMAVGALAGPLTPPVGPVAPTAKPLVEVEPRVAINLANTPGDADSLFRITQPGSYYLTGNITGEVGKHGIEIVVSGVTIDLNGFDLIGVPGMGPFDGITATEPNLTSVGVRNGSVRNWGGDGVDLGIESVVNCLIEGVRANGNGNNGIRAGEAAVITGCSATANASNGLFALAAATITDCVAVRNGANGFVAGVGSTITSCSSRSNTGSGINASFGSTVRSFTAYQNAINGIVSAVGCTVIDCTVRENVVNGISCLNQSLIRGNLCSGNGNGAGNGAGILVTGGDSVIDGNTCVSNRRGVDVDGTSNIIVKNTCSNNVTNWDIVVGNSVGPIASAGTNAVAITGNGAVASTLGSTDPNTNFSF